MGLMEAIKGKAILAKKRVVLPEGTEERTIKAAAIIAKEGIAIVTLLGNEEQIKEKAKGLDYTGITIIDPLKSEKIQSYADKYYELRKHKGVTPQTAKQQMCDPLYYACMMIKMCDADGMVAGAINTTGDTLRPAFQIIKTAPGISVVSSSFIMELPTTQFGHDGVLMFGDCAVNPNPTADELAAIAISTAKTGAQLVGMDPKVAMLSFSTKGSAEHELVDKVRLATQKVQELAPDLCVDGELQVDAAIIESVGQLKSPGSKVAGKANVLIFPDLQSGNIGYKLVQRLAGAQAIGPVSQGLAAPVNDLSRGCSVEDIVAVVAITAVQAIN